MPAQAPSSGAPTVRLSLDHDPTIAVIVIHNPPVNGISNAVRSGLAEQLAAAQQAAAVRAIVVTAAGDHWLTGQDVREFGQPVVGPTLRELTGVMEAMPLPVIVVAPGAAFGGGVELMLCADRRVAANRAVFAFPEVQYGLLPGAGGTQRLPRLVGTQTALEWMVTGQTVSAQCALAVGLVDEIYDPEATTPVQAGLAAARRWLREDSGKRRVSAMTVATTGPEDAVDTLMARAGSYRVPARMRRCVEAAVHAPRFDEGLAVEWREHEACREDPQHRAMLHQFFAERRARQLPDRVLGRADALSRVAVVGAGTMGLGIALACLHGGFSVELHDPKAAALDRAKQQIEKLLERDVTRGRLSAAAAQSRRERLYVADTLERIRQPDLVIEAVFEDLPLKRKLFAEFDALWPDAQLLASNTSTLDMAAIANATARPERVVGLHFFSPAHLMPLVEIVVGDWCDTGIEHLARDVTRRLNKVGVVVGNGFGFVGNKMLYAYGRENQLMLLEGAAPQRIDAVLQRFGMAMGPNAVGDLAGLDVGYRARQGWRDRPTDPRFYRVADALVEAGRLGQKTGAGCFRYEPGSRKPLPDPTTDALIREQAKLLGVAQREHSDEEILERSLYALAVEGARLLDAGIARSAADIDVIWANGYGFPRYAGGPMHHAEQVGLDRVIARAQHFATATGQPEAWAVPPTLAALARNAGQFPRS